MYNTTCFIYTFLILTNITLKGKDMEKEKKKKTSNARTSNGNEECPRMYYQTVR